MRNLDSHEDYKVDKRQLHRDLARLLENVNSYVGARYRKPRLILDRIRNVKKQIPPGHLDY